MSDELHAVHRRAGWPSVRELARALGAGVVSSSRIHDAFTKPRLPAWGLVQVLVVELAGRTPGADADTEVKRFHGLWDEAAQADGSSRILPMVNPVPPAQPPVAAVERPVLRTLLMADVDSRAAQDEAGWKTMRHKLIKLLDQVTYEAGVSPGGRARADWGDAVLTVISAPLPAGRLVRSLLKVLPEDLAVANRRTSASSQIRMRLVVTPGFVTLNEEGHWVGSDLTRASKLLDSNVLRDALRDASGDHVLCVTEPVYEDVVRHEYDGVPANAFHKVLVSTKEGPLHAWLHQPPLRLNW
ncbi:hypothetical protein ACFYZ4_11315 [Streptomyces sp. NPDC001513]|uniref:hypothetical protein n=1 Tax=Streptomyces sp. NPDC001513 TaxID=3364580 RepID=UPI0036CE1A37